MSDKAAVLAAVNELPDTLSFEEITEHLATIAAIHRGAKAADEGRVKTPAEVRRLLATWTAN